jgi:pantoate--beta-alanine ligase
VTVVCATRAELANARAGLAGRVGVVMTMGALHSGHAALLRAARAECDHVIATIFVNPLQFGPSEDLDRYPRTPQADLDLLRAEGVAVAFMPSVAEIYPSGTPTITVNPGPLGSVLEGAHRPGHFDGVLTVVLKLLHLTGADRAYFGEKDYQQLTLIRAMVTDLDVPTTIVAVPTVREPDGLALSSRNRYLSDVERETALALSRALRAGASRGAEGAQAVLAAARAELGDLPVDYLELTSVDLTEPPPRGPARLLVAARVGQTRLIDNIGLVLGPPGTEGRPGAPD